LTFKTIFVEEVAENQVCVKIMSSVKD
jgi:hypothetical protein